MKKFVPYISIIFYCLILCIIESCQNEKLKYEETDCDYSNCKTEEPMVSQLDIKLTINSENPK